MYTIAIVEDAEDNRDFLYYLLRDEYEVICCASGEEALSRFRKQRPDVIVMDIALGDINGIDVLSRIRKDESLRNIPVIALTAHAMSGDKERYLAAGFDEYVPKPILDLQMLIFAIRRCLPR